MIELSLIPLSPIPSTISSAPKKLIIDLGDYIQLYTTNI